MFDMARARPVQRRLFFSSSLRFSNKCSLMRTRNQSGSSGASNRMLQACYV